MSIHTDQHQIISQDGKPAFAVIPYDEYLELLEHAGGRPDEDVILPHEVVKLSILGGMSLIRAWREHLGLTQEEIARRMGISQPAYAKFEAKDAHPRVVSCKRIAEAMGIEWEQLME